MRLPHCTSVIAIALCLSACARRATVLPPAVPAVPDYRQLITMRAASELPCAQAQISVEPLGFGGYRATGCGRWISYTCSFTTASRVCGTNDRGTFAESTPPAAVAPQQAARERVDSRSAALLACSGTDALALQVSWSASGSLDAMLRDALSGTPAEECVRGIVQALAIPAPGAPGTVLHAIQRDPPGP
jgi:hypothetical protein